MHYQGTRVPLSEKKPGFRSAGIPSRGLWGSGRSSLGRTEQKEEGKKFSLSMLVPKGKPEVEPAAASEAPFYRRSAVKTERPAIFRKLFPSKEKTAASSLYSGETLGTPVYSKTEDHWVPQAPTLRSMRWAGWAMGAIFLVLAAYWGKQKVTVALQDAVGLKLAKVIVQGEHYLTDGQIARTADLPMGESMFKLDLEGAEERLRKLEWVDRVFIERRLPSSILVSVRERKPVVLLDNGALYGVDREGRLLRPAAALLNEDLPLVSGVRFPAEAIGTTRLAETLKPALDFLTFLAKKDPVTAQDVSEVNLSDADSLKVTFINGTQATFNTVVTDKELKRMARVLGDLNEKGKKAGTMDLRYRDMVLVRTR